MCPIRFNECDLQLSRLVKLHLRSDSVMVHLKNTNTRQTSRKALTVYFDTDAEKIKFEDMLDIYKKFYGLKPVNDAVKKSLDDSFRQHGYTTVNAQTQESNPDDILNSAYHFSL